MTQLPFPLSSPKNLRIESYENPIVLFVDDAHDLNGNTLRGLKRIIERVHRRRGRLSVVLAGHPKLKNDLRRPTLEENRR